MRTSSWLLASTCALLAPLRAHGQRPDVSDTPPPVRTTVAATAAPAAPVAAPEATLLDRTGVSGSAAVESALAARLLVSPPGRLRIELGTTVLRDLAGNHATTLAARASFDLGRFRLAVAQRTDRVFLPGRDAVDLYSAARVELRATRVLGLGVEYVARDLEDLFDDDGDGGLQQRVAADATLFFPGGWLVRLGPALSLTRNALDPDATPLEAHVAVGHFF